MRRVMVTFGVLTLLAAMLVVVSAPSLGAGQVCDGRGKSGVAGLTPGPKAKGDFDGDGVKDVLQLFYDPADDFKLVSRVKLANGYRAFYKHVDALGPLAQIVKIVDLDRDGDHEALINVFAQDPTAPHELLTLADCKLVAATASDNPGFPAKLYTGEGGPIRYGLACTAPSTAGRGITQFTGGYEFDLVTFNSTRTEYRLIVDEQAGTALLKKLREKSQKLNEATKRGAALIQYANSFNCDPPPKCDDRRSTIVGTPFNDKIVGTNGKDVAAGLDGNDVMNLKGGADQACGGTGKDTVNAGGGNDRVFGQGSDDTLNGQGGNDRLVGGGGVDTADGGPGTDSCSAETVFNC